MKPIEIKLWGASADNYELELLEEFKKLPIPPQGFHYEKGNESVYIHGGACDVFTTVYLVKDDKNYIALAKYFGIKPYGEELPSNIPIGK